VDALGRAGRLDDARLTFEKMLTYANHVGLYSEEIGLTGEQLGNFPQAFTHLALIDAAITLNAALDRRTPVHAEPGAGIPSPRAATQGETVDLEPSDGRAPVFVAPDPVEPTSR
jgi:pentatricopeptide repeat protein